MREKFLAWRVENWPVWVKFCIEHTRDICFRTSACYNLKTFHSCAQMYDKLILTHCGPVTPCGVVEFGHLFIRTSLSPFQRQAIAFRSQCKVIVISTQRHQFQWNFNGYINIFHSRKCIWYKKVGAILFRPRCILSISPYIVLGINFPARWALLLLWLPPANFWKMTFIKKIMNTHVLLQRYDIMYVTLSCFV